MNSRNKPMVLDNTQTEDGCSLKLFLPADLVYFTGHFPNVPVLPGLVQINWAVDYAKELALIDQHLRVHSLETLKFQHILIPEQEVVLTLYRKSRYKITFEYRSSKGKHGSGRILFKEGE